MPGDPTAAQEWRDAYDRVTELARTAGDDGLAVTVPATPDWTARDLLAHMIGVGIDAKAGDAPDDLNPTWTQGHVDARNGASLDDLLGEWADHADEIQSFIADTATDPLGDIIIHEQDLRGALGEPGARDTGGLAAIRDAMLDMMTAEIPDDAAPLQLRATDGDFTWASGDGSPGAVVEASGFDLFRAATSRRTDAQLQEYTTEGSVTPYLDAFGHLAQNPTEPLAE